MPFRLALKALTLNTETLILNKPTIEPGTLFCRKLCPPYHCEGRAPEHETVWQKTTGAYCQV